MSDEADGTLRVTDAQLLANASDVGDAYIIRYDDPDRRDELFTGYGARDAAVKRFNQAQTNWTCHLFRRVAGPGPRQPSGDDRVEAVANALYQADHGWALWAWDRMWRELPEDDRVVCSDDETHEYVGKNRYRARARAAIAALDAARETT